MTILSINSCCCLCYSWGGGKNKNAANWWVILVGVRPGSTQQCSSVKTSPNRARNPRVHETVADTGNSRSWFSVGSAHFSDPPGISGDLKKALWDNECQVSNWERDPPHCIYRTFSSLLELVEGLVRYSAAWVIVTKASAEKTRYATSSLNTEHGLRTERRQAGPCNLLCREQLCKDL